VSRALGSLVAYALLGPALLQFAPTHPPRAPVSTAVAASVGVVAGLALFTVLARARPRVLLDPLVTAAALLVAAVGMSEEALWRAFALGRLAPSVGAGAAVAITTAAFAATHLPMLRARGAAVHVLTGATFGVLFVTTGSLVACALAHASYNVLAVLARSRARPASAAISCARAEKRYGDRIALAPLDLTVERGELVALLGPNGAGKTTLVSLVTGLRRPTAGTVRIFGGDPRDWRARIRLGTTPQEMGFPPTLRSREILELARAHAAKPPPLASLVEQFDLAAFADRQTGALSGGQRRRLALALAFANAPKLAVLDEPTTGLDLESRRRAWSAIASFAEDGGTVLLTTHYLEEAQALSGRIVVLARGEVVADGLRADDLEQAYLRLTR
jgi:ABC-type multidrug transport system ATPase subunit/membrane protease YdiL (CAAX protease family)